jgi:hypothetical protein
VVFKDAVQSVVLSPWFVKDEHPSCIIIINRISRYAIHTLGNQDTMFITCNGIPFDNNKTSKQNNNVGDNNEGGNQTNSEEENGGKRDDESSSSDDNEQYEDDRDKANKEDIKTKFWETNSDGNDEENEQDRTEGDNKEGDNTQEDCEMSNTSENVSCKDASNKKRVGARARLGMIML